MRHVLLLAVIGCVSATGARAQAPFEEFDRAWCQDPYWQGGAVESALYTVTRWIDGEAVTSTAHVSTRLETVSPETFTRSRRSEPAREAIASMLREDWGGELGKGSPGDTRRLATLTYVGVTDHKSLKLEFSRQDVVGPTFKRYINHAGTVRWDQYSPQPGEGHGSGSYSASDNLAFYNALPTVLRGYPFSHPREIAISLVEDQASDRWTRSDPAKFVIRYGGLHELDLPIGKVAAHQLILFYVGAAREFQPPVKFHFAADPALRHIMLTCERPDRVRYELKELERRTRGARSE